MAIVHQRAKSFLVAAAGLGMTCGLLEGAMLLSLQAAGLSTWIMNLRSVGPPILWVSPLVNTVVFLLAAFWWILLAWLLPRRDVYRWALVFFSFLTFYDLLACTDRLRERGAILLALGLAVQTGIFLSRRQPAFHAVLRRGIPVLTVVCLILWAGVTFGLPWQEAREVAATAPPPTGSPNVLLIVWDTARADHTSLHGYSRDTTPNLTRRAATGIVFKRAYSASSWTPSHATLFTGSYPHQLGGEGLLPARFTTIAEFLRDHGYATASLVANSAWLTRSSGLVQGFTHHEDYFGNVQDSLRRTLFGRKLAKYVFGRFGLPGISGRKDAGTITRDFLAWLGSRPPGRPFFAFLNYYDLHEPVFPQDAFAARFADPHAIRSRRPLQTHKPLPDTIPPARLRADVDAYDAALAYLDSEFELLIQSLEQRDLLENTIVVLTSDHGHSFGEAGVYGHRTSVRVEQVHVPLVVWWPSRIRRGQTEIRPVGHSRIPATLSSLAGLPSSPFQEIPLFDLSRTMDPEILLGQPPLAELARPDSDEMDEDWPVSCGDLVSIFSGDWHFIRCATGKEELYDLKTDPQELQNLASRSEAGVALSTLRAELASVVSPSTRLRIGAAAAPPAQR